MHGKPVSARRAGRSILLSATVLMFVGMSSHADEAVAQKEFKILTYNVLVGFQNRDSRVEEGFVEWVTRIDPDVIAFQEMNRFTSATLAAFATRYGHPHSVLSKEDGYPVALTSKHSMTDVKSVRDGVHHGRLLATVSGIQFIVVHLAPHSADKNYHKRKSESAAIAAEAAQIPEGGRLVILGDFNDVSETDTAFYKDTGGAEIYGEHVYSATRTLAAAGLIDVMPIFHSNFQPTARTVGWLERSLDPNGHVRVHAAAPQRRIDYVWVNAPLRDRVTSAVTIRDAFTDSSSDHYPLLVVIEAGEGRGSAP